MADKQMHLLLIEDNPDDAKLTQDMLEKAANDKLEIVIADQLSTGIKHLTKKQPDVILLDLGLPDSQGLDSVTKLYNLGLKIPIVVLTGWDDESASINAIKQGAQDYLIKGKVNGHELWKVVNYAIERENLIQELRESETNYHEVIEGSNDGIIIILDGKAAFVNSQIVKMLGLSLKEILGEPFVDFVDTESRNLVMNMNDMRTWHQVVSQKFEIEFIGQNGKEIPAEISTSVIKYKGQAAYMVLIHDITNRKQVEETLRQNVANLKTYIDNSPDGIFIVNQLGIYMDVNPAACKFLGYSPKELIGMSLLQIVPSIDVEDTKKIFMELQEKGELEEDIKLLKKDGSLILVNLKAVRIPQDRYIAYCRDITKRVEAEQEIKVLEEKAQVSSRLAAVGAMAAGIAHEINNPLTAVIGFSQLLLEKQNVPEDVKEDVRIIAYGSKRVADIVKRLLTFARQTKPIQTLTNLNELIDNTLKLREYVLKTGNIDVVTRFDPELPLSVVDPGQLQQVFLNLIVNAEQAMKKAHGKGTLIITSEMKENNIQISFQDDGPGITKENIKRLFEPFFTTKDVGEGTGLGLSLSRSIVLEHGGKMRIDSEFGHGATFIIELPIVESPPVTITTSNQIKVYSALEKSGRIMVVDDEPGVGTLLEKVLTQIGYAVDIITEAGIVMDKLNAGTKYDAILLDIRMPGMSGTELYNHILKKEPALIDRIIIITGDIMGMDIKNFLDKYNLPYLAKPFDINLLKEKIDNIMI